VKAYKGLLDALHVPELQAKALDVVRNILQQSFTLESQFRAMNARQPHNSPFNLFIMHLPHALLTKEVDDIPQIREFVSILIQDILGFAREDQEESPRLRDPNFALHRLAARFTALCYQPDWKSKAAGFAGLELMTSGVEVGLRLTLEREIEVVRALLFVLKDMAHNTPRNSDDVLVTLTRVIKTCNSNSLTVESPEASMAVGKLMLLTTILLQELPSQHSAVRSAAQVCLRTLAESYGKSLFDLLAPYKERLLQSIYAKPLRALPLASQIGYIDAMTYCLSVNPPLAEANDDFTRLLQEVLGMALGDNELEDEAIGPGGARATYRHNILTTNELRVAYIRFFTAAMPVYDLFSKQPSTRQKLVAQING
jgi:transformation/transcription domain-associated protein